jgi:prepilin-type processing-associated H-X9-DG protein
MTKKPVKIKSNSTKSKTHGLTLIEVLVALIVVIILAAVLWPSNTERKGAMLSCVNNLKEIGLALTMYADDNNGRFPLQITATNTSTTEFNYSNHVFPRFQVVSNELGREPKLLICPFDTTRQAAASFETLNDSNISYFFNADADRNSSTNSILSGDRFLENDGQSVNSGLFTLTTNLNMSWTPSIHKGGGNVLWSDGSVQQTASAGLRSIVRSQLLATNRLLIP